jgi:cytochrome c-type biogenesis protein
MTNVGVPTAFLAGLASFLTPCVLPLVPGYVSLISGVGIEELKTQEAGVLRRVMVNSIAFVLGFSIVFVTLGALSTGIGQLTQQYKALLAQVAGVLVIVFGLHLTGILRIKALYADKRLHGVKGGTTPWGAFVIGFAFAFGWTPCVGPILSGILVIAAAQSSIGKGILLLTVYSLGLAVPFLLTALGIERFMKFYVGFRRYMHGVEIASGALLIALGLLLVSGKFTVLSRYFSFLNRFAL